LLALISKRLLNAGLLRDWLDIARCLNAQAVP